MNADDRTDWLNPSPPLPIDGEEHQGPPDHSTSTNQHFTRVRDLRRRFGDADQCVALCSCGWRGEARAGMNGERRARRDAAVHVDQVRRNAESE